MRRVALGLLGLSLLAGSVAGQAAAIQTRRVMTLGDDDGPGSIATASVAFAKMSDGRIVLAAMVYDVAALQLVAEQMIPGYVAGFLDDTHFMRYAVDSKDIPRMEVWEMTIKP